MSLRDRRMWTQQSSGTDKLLLGFSYTDANGFVVSSKLEAKRTIRTDRGAGTEDGHEPA